MKLTEITQKLQASFPLSTLSPAACDLFLGETNMHEQGTNLYWDFFHIHEKKVDFENAAHLRTDDFGQFLVLALYHEMTYPDPDRYPWLDLFFGDLIAYVELEYWDDHFMRKWLRFSDAQLDVLLECIDALSDHFMSYEIDRMHLNFGNIRKLKDLNS